MTDRRSDAKARPSSSIGLIATDLDGTLLRADGSISNYTRGVLQRAARVVPIVLVTARPPRRARLIAHEIGVEGLVICCNGALVYDSVSETVSTHTPIPSIDPLDLVKALRAALPGVCFAFELETRYGCEREYVELASRDGMQMDADGVIGDALDLCAMPVTKLIARHADHEAATLAEKVATTVTQRFVTTHSGTTFIEISREGVDKASALATICAARGVAPRDVLAFGDRRNDLPMLRWAGHPVAVANAHPEVLAEIPEVTETNENDGVARAIEHLML